MRLTGALLIAAGLWPPLSALDEGPAELASAGPPAAMSPEDVAASKALLDDVIRTIRAALPRRRDLARNVDPEMLTPHYVAEFTRQFRPLLTTELRFIETVCQPGPEQLKTIETAGASALQLTVKQYADIQVQVEQDGFRSYEEREWPNPRAVILEALSASVRQALPADQAARYEKELELRAALRRRTTVLCLVTKLDRELLLTAEQRKEIEGLLTSSWQDSWALVLEGMPHYESGRFPVTIPDELMLPILGEVQQRLWKGWRKSKNRLRGWTGFGFLHPLPEEEPEESPVEEKP